MDLALQLHRQAMLSVVFSSYPVFRLRRFGLPKEKVRSTTWFHAALLAKWKCFGSNLALDRWAARRLLRLHTTYLLNHIPPCDILVALSGSGLEAGQRVQRQGGSYVCDRGSTHIRYGDRLMHEEFARWGQSYPGTDPMLVAREEREYEVADTILVPSGFARRSFVEMGVDAAKLRQIPLGVDLARFRKCGDPPRNRFEVLFVGQVSFRKGIPYLLEAFASLKHPSKRLRIVGSKQREISDFLKHRELGQVEFLGPVRQTKLAAIMSTSHVLVLPSIEDGFGMVMSQAMACGCPVICSRNSAADELVLDGREGFVVPIRDSAAIAARLEQLSCDFRLQTRMSHAAIERVERSRGWDDYGEQCGSLCRELVSLTSGTRRRPPPDCQNSWTRASEEP